MRRSFARFRFGFSVEKRYQRKNYEEESLCCQSVLKTVRELPFSEPESAHFFFDSTSPSIPPTTLCPTRFHRTFYVLRRETIQLQSGKQNKTKKTHTHTKNHADFIVSQSSST